MSRTVHALYPIRKVAALTGLRLEMLDYLCRTGIVIPSGKGARGRGKSRQYSFGDIVFLRVIAKLLRAGISVKRMKERFAQVGETFQGFNEVSEIAGFLVTDGVDIYFKESASTIVELNGQQCFAFLIEIGGVRNEVIQEMERLRQRA
ncbi:MerR family transcriptional regulator [Bradyrhizobium sp. U531]|uniref:helix-turn-helix domain-containing protein n=1 Tax=Bradyrhizobium sp. U531 TaxID=3053458 RepID=UPI003F41FEE9